MRNAACTYMNEGRGVPRSIVISTVHGSLPNQHFILLQYNVEFMLFITIFITMCPLKNTIALSYLFVQFQVVDMLHVNKAWTRLRINGC